jgi:hypothetical protein
MQLHTHLWKSIFGKTALAAAALGGLFFLGGAPSAKANEYPNRPAIRYDDRRLHEAIVNRGYYSPRAEYWRHERREAFERGWYDRFGCWHRY